MFFCNFPIKLRRFWWNMVKSFLNKFAAKCCKSLQPYRNRPNVFTLLLNLKSSMRTCYHWVVTEKNFIIYPTSTVAPNLLDLNPVEYSDWDYCKRRCELELPTTLLTNGCNNDDMIQLGTSVAVSVRRDHCCVFCTLSFAIVHTRCNQLHSNLANLEATVEVW